MWKAMEGKDIYSQCMTCSGYRDFISLYTRFERNPLNDVRSCDNKVLGGKNNYSQSGHSIHHKCISLHVYLNKVIFLPSFKWLNGMSWDDKKWTDDGQIDYNMSKWCRRHKNDLYYVMGLSCLQFTDATVSMD